MVVYYTLFKILLGKGKCSDNHWLVYSTRNRLDTLNSTGKQCKPA